MRPLCLLALVACSSDHTTVDAPTIPPAEAGIDAPSIDAFVETGALCTANNIPGRCLDTAECRDSRHPTAGLCAGPATTQCCTPRFADGIACDPNARPLPNAALVEETGDPGCPDGMARIDGTFCVDRYEASLEGVSPYAPPPANAKAVSIRGAVPQGFISQLEAQAACTASGKRLCTDAEWLRACRGPTNTTYPYGNTKIADRCNESRAQHPAVELYGTSDSWIFSHLDSPCLSQLPDGLERTATHDQCVTAEGAFDMMGNLHEWTADPNGTFRGGFFVDTVANGPGCTYATTAHDTSYADYSTGFRCCAD